MSITKFDNSIFAGAPELSHLNFDNSFKIDFNKNSIIFGFNAIGKTSISKFLATKYPDQFYLINYEDEKDTIKATKAGKKIELTPDYHRLQLAKDELAIAKEKVDLFSRIEKSTGLSKSKLTTSSPKYFANAKKLEAITELSITKDQFEEIDNVLNPVKYIFGVNIQHILSECHNVTKEIENMQLGLVKKFSKEYFECLQKDENSNICPVCHQTLDKLGGDLRNLLEQNLSDLANVAESYFSDYLSKNSIDENKTFLNSLSNLIAKYSNNENIFYEYLMVDTSEEIIDLNEKIRNQNEKQNVVNMEQESLKTLSLKLSSIEQTSKKFFIENFDFKDVAYDAKKETLNLVLPDDRDAKTYSQGELNIITLVAMLSIAGATDKPNIIIDDPLSSYDLPNQYKIMYKIIKFIRDNDTKFVTLFTHNPEALNIGYQYKYGCDFEYKYIEKYSSSLFVVPLKMNKNVINVDDYISIDSEGYLIANRDREDPLYNDPLVLKTDLHEIFHFDKTDVSIPYKTFNLSNASLYKKVNTFVPSDIAFGDFEHNTLSKVYYLMSLRVYIEKKFSEISDEIKNALDNQPFGEKLKLIQESYLAQAKTVYPNFDIEVLKEMKVMLNQNEHFNSQVQPYYYAINISLDDLIDEINKVKAMFA